MDSGFCVTAGILALHDKGVYGQSLIKKRGRYWPKDVPGDAIDEHFNGKELGTSETLKQVIDGKEFLVHCQKDDGYVTKMMSTHGLNNEVDHPTSRRVGNERKRFKYTEPISNHKRSAHWVDDVNNRRHGSIGLEDVWRAKWWPHRQFTFLCEIAEVNAVNSRARARKEDAEVQLVFRRKLAMQMLENKLDDMGYVLGIPTSPIRLSFRPRANKHELKTRELGRGSFDPAKKKWTRTSDPYQKTKCAHAQNG
eukprot:scaffold12953_cov123-Skeletonema_dohrnii-CCMP3373.AAC.9